jgi:hypothetical protein
LYLFWGELVAQVNFVPLKIDSSYAWTFSTSGADTFINETWYAYSYDGIDSLMQIRTSNWRFKFSYNGSIKIMIRENLDTAGNWVDTYRKTTQFNANGQVSSELGENLLQGISTPSTLFTFHYNAFGKDTFWLGQLWNNGVWESFRHRDRKYDLEGNMIEEAEYFYDNNGEAEYNRGELFEYDAQNRLVQQIHVNGSINGPYYTSRLNWHFNGENQVDTLVRCHYVSSSSLECENVGMATYQYFGNDSTRQSQFNWVDGAWSYYGYYLNFLNTPVYGPEPDSILFFHFSKDNQEYTHVTRQLFHYEEIGDNMFYFTNYSWRYFSNQMVWFLTKIEQRWYRKSLMVNTKNEKFDLPEISLWPNPCRSKELINLGSLPQINNRSIGIFDGTGRKNLWQNISDAQEQTQIVAPSQPGNYSIILFHGEVPIAMSKVLVH